MSEKKKLFLPRFLPKINGRISSAGLPLTVKTFLIILFISFPALLLTAQSEEGWTEYTFITAATTISVPSNWTTEQETYEISSTAPDGLASLYCTIIDPTSTGESFSKAAELFTSEIEDFTFKDEGNISTVNGLTCFSIEGEGVINHAGISVSLSFYTTPSGDIIMVASVYSTAYGEIYYGILQKAAQSLSPLPER